MANVKIIKATIPMKDVVKIEEKPPLKVAAYCRVSTKMELQQNSLQNQIEYFTKKIGGHPNWVCAGIYADNGLSGTSSDKRKQFQKMIRNSKRGKIDLILVKSVQRFYRNFGEGLEYVDLLSSYGVNIIFEEENIDTAKSESRILLQFLLIMAQAEIENLSKNIKWGKQRKLQEGKVTYSARPYGYVIDDNRNLEILPEEAVTVKRIYHEYINGATYTMIAAGLTEDGIPTAKGLVRWNADTVRNILCNEVYAGDILRQKTYVTNFMTHKAKRNLGEEAKYWIRDNHDPILDRDTCRLVQEEMVRRKCKKKNHKNDDRYTAKHSGKYALANVLVCERCGDRFRRCINRGVAIWRCRNRLLNGGPKACKAATIIEEVLIERILHTVTLARSEYSLMDLVVNRYLEDGYEIDLANTMAVEITEQLEEKLRYISFADYKACCKNKEYSDAVNLIVGQLVLQIRAGLKQEISVDLVGGTTLAL